MPVENTASPNVSPSAPNGSPRNVRPSSSTRMASCVIRSPWTIFEIERTHASCRSPTDLSDPDVGYSRLSV